MILSAERVSLLCLLSLLVVEFTVLESTIVDLEPGSAFVDATVVGFTVGTIWELIKRFRG